MHLWNGVGLQARQVGSGPDSSPGGPPSSSVSLNMTNTPTATASPTASATSTTSSNGGGSSSVIIPIIAAVLGVLLALSVYILLRRTRMRHKNPKYVPTPFLKKLWEKWEPNPIKYRLPDTNDSLEPISNGRTTGLRPPGRSTAPPSSFDTATREAVAAAEANTAAAGVDRNTSVRSVMTLPAYHQNAMNNEQVLGREGDRGGIDVVIEFPETVDEEELRREEEMEALYQVRLARRRENEEREERRRLRREARERGDYVALREIAARARAASSTSASQTVEDLRAEHERIKKERQRAVSSVSYADLGVARHDGTRLRANSQDSERQGLLGDAASIAASSHYHRRDRSASSVLSLDTMNDDLPSPRLTRSRANSGAASVGRSSHQAERPGTAGTRAGSSPEMIEHDDIPPNSPPGYENISLDTPHDEIPRNPLEPPPDYSSPVLARGDPHPTIESELPTSEFNTRRDSRRQSTASSRRESRRSSTHIAQLISDSRTSSNASSGSHRSGVGGVPQLPSLRLAQLPSILVDPGSPRVGRVQEENFGDEERDLTDQREHHQ
ncbi:uncharacterized protein LY89DRAFT_732423 [Mollisia scopiformis]|uniref:Uncharacterized protein n=1 Tax=Mollisia scopiformis TaxID=149040 RepID=A0A194XGI1_MOLSC|nr:uncharacterized protein LY89DRAFT_732423 [Mollisia scopiformis]KUJ18882.1 hypothetical protein LY89DRAFT_732423 [Mollisia scopiformis]